MTHALISLRTDCQYIFNLIYMLGFAPLTCFDFIKQILIFWLARLHHWAYLNKYDAHSFLPFWVDFKYVFHLIYLLGPPLLTLLIFSGRFQSFSLLDHNSRHISMNTRRPLYRRSDATLGMYLIQSIPWIGITNLFLFYQANFDFLVYCTISTVGSQGVTCDACEHCSWAKIWCDKDQNRFILGFILADRLWKICEYSLHSCSCTAVTRY
jgi:hypothetical protein